MTQISSERIASIEARKQELADAMAASDLPPNEFIRLSKDYAAIEPVAAAAREVRRLRAAHVAAEVFVTGSARKRYDRAMKTKPAAIVSLDVRDGEATRGFKLLDNESERAKAAQEIFDAV